MSDIYDKIQKLLALSGDDRGNEHEAEVAAGMAQKLMTDHNISLAMIAAASHDNDIIGVDKTTIDENTRAQWKQSLAGAVARSMGGRLVFTPWSKYGGEGKLHFFGPTDSVPVMVEVYRYLKLQLDLASVNALVDYKSNGHAEIMWDGRKVHGKTYRNSWLMGAVSRLSSRLTEAYNRQVAETEGASSALVVINDRVDDLVDQTYNHLRKSPVRSTSYSSKGYQDGHTAGGRMDLGQNKVGGGRLHLNA